MSNLVYAFALFVILALISFVYAEIYFFRSLKVRRYSSEWIKLTIDFGFCVFLGLALIFVPLFLFDAFTKGCDAPNIIARLSCKFR